MGNCCGSRRRRPPAGDRSAADASWRITKLWRRVCATLDVRVRDDQNLILQLFVSLMIVGYGVLVASVLVPAAVSQTDTWRLKQQVFAVFEVVAVLYCLWGAALADPGQVPRGWNGSKEAPLQDGHGWCRFCNEWKPPRAHHCSACERCVMRYDHHCDWVDNCVGERNHKCFILFLWYVTVCCFHYFFCLYHYVYSGEPWGRPLMEQQLGQDHWRRPRRMRREGDMTWPQLGWLVGLGVYTVAAFGLLIFAAAFCYCTTNGAAVNQTTYDENTMDREHSKGFSRGCFRNCQEILGVHPLLWLVPQVRSVTCPDVPGAEPAPTPGDGRRRD
eukprot:TRINITY_DN19199_c0_g1_i1.p2 TRINITY_DN19199_c0_g1~~TRINITY_DN19199_c0_g1_i1.p2  ORF type:complete len:357 (+),score=103.04 TRINITY_DN19199_c0_g1_i1:83-1072(+)